MILQQLASLKMHLALQQGAKDNEKTAKPLLDPSLSVAYYELEFTHSLGGGALGAIHRGLWQDQEVIIKGVDFDLESDQNYQILLNEAQILNGLRHPKVVGLYGVCIEPKRLCLVMEYLNNGTLSETLVKNSLKTDQKQNIALDIAKGLAYLHSRQVLHRNLTSKHVLLDSNYQAKLSSFGFAKTKMHSIKNSGRRSTNLGFRAPECFKRGGEHTEASDVYSFGMILYELLTDKRPFAEYDGQDFALAQAVQAGKRPEIPKTVPKSYADLIESCWQQDGKKRPSIKEILSCLASSTYNLVQQATVPPGEGNEHKRDDQNDQNDKLGELTQFAKPPKNRPTALSLTGMSTPPPDMPGTPGYCPSTPRKFSCESPFSPTRQSVPGEKEYKQGLDYEKEQKFTEAYACYEEALKQGHCKAFTNAGFLLLSGKGVTPDKLKAHEYFIVAAKQDHIRAIINAAKMLEIGDGVSKNLSEALFWYEKALALGEKSVSSQCETLRNQLAKG
jgi:serine/threonine protein kinase